MSKSDFSEEFKRHAVRQITEEAMRHGEAVDEQAVCGVASVKLSAV